MAIDTDQLEKVTKRLETEDNIWLATVRPDGRPHLIPIWFVWHDKKIWICTPPSTQKIINIKHNPRVTVALENGSQPVILEGTVDLRPGNEIKAALTPHFKKKYDWTLTSETDDEYILFEITPLRMISW